MVLKRCLSDETLQDRLQSLGDKEKQCFTKIKSKWQSKRRLVDFDDEMLLKFVKCSKDEKHAYKCMKRYSKQHLQRINKVHELDNLRYKTILPLDVKGIDGSSTIYLRPMQYDPLEKSDDKKSSLNDFLSALCYFFDTLMENSPSITVILNMKGWVNNDEFWTDLMGIIQGYRYPVNVSKMIILNQPDWCKQQWKQMSKDISSSFKVLLEDYKHMQCHFMNGFNDHMPTEIGGKLSGSRILESFIIRRSYYEKEEENESEKIVLKLQRVHRRPRRMASQRDLHVHQHQRLITFV